MARTSVPLSEVYRLLEPGPVVLVTTSFNGESDVMAMSWHMMVEFEPPMVACIISEQNHSFHLLERSHECVINIPTVELAQTVVGVGNTSGASINKFEQFHLTPEAASEVQAPLLKECYACLECKVIDTSMVKKLNLFILEVLKAWRTPMRKRPRTIHHCGMGSFVVDGTKIQFPSEKK
jgi:flavin reductase (DIM6/NTAB) family NADH-FMN oxidoreductase RutF